MKKQYEAPSEHSIFPELKFQPSPFMPFTKEPLKYQTHVVYPDFFYPYEFTGWKDEQLSWKKTCYLHAGLNYPPLLRVSGPDSKAFLSKYCVNTFEKFPTGSAKHCIACNEDGNILSDGLILRLDEETYDLYFMYSVSAAAAEDGVNFDVRFADMTYDTFLFQVGGPKALEVLERATGDDLHDIGFMKFRDTSINGMRFRAGRWGMAGSLAYELHGKREDAAAIYEAIWKTGEPMGMRRLGFHTYMMQHTEDGFPQFGYHFAMGSGNKMQSIGSCESGVDLLRNPFELGWGSCVKFDHDFIGREALEKIAIDPKRTIVTLEWNKDDILKVYASRFEDGEPYHDFENVNDHIKFIGSDIYMYQDRVLDSDGKDIGYSNGRMYSYYYRRMISLGCIDIPYAEEGTDVVVLWGSPDEPQLKIRAKVTRFPYYNEYNNRTYDVEAVPHINE